MQPVAIVLPLMTVGLGALFFSDATDAAWWLSFARHRHRASRSRSHSGCTRSSIASPSASARSSGYARMLALACDAHWTSPALTRLKGRLCVGGAAPALVAKLARLGGWSELRIGAALLHFPLQAITLWDFHVYFAMERWRAHSGRHVRGWIEALGSVDALAVLAMARSDEPEWAVRPSTQVETC